MARFWSYVASTGEERVLVPLLECGEPYSYTVPSFSVITVQMRRIKYQYITGEGVTEVTQVADGFIREDQSLQRLYPAEVSVKVDSASACIVHVSELEKSIDVRRLTLVDEGAFVIWEWEWAQSGDNSDSSDGEEIPVIPDSQSNCSSDGSEAQASEDELASLAASLTFGTTSLVTHTVTFKCIGCTKELKYQENLAEIAKLRNSGQEIPCTIKPEPDNPFDSEAIAFKCKLHGTWCTIGYVVKEALKEVHDALAEKHISKVSLCWVKYIIYWRVPGWYAGINITRIGEWSQTVQLSQSARMR